MANIHKEENRRLKNVKQFKVIFFVFVFLFVFFSFLVVNIPKEEECRPDNEKQLKVILYPYKRRGPIQ